jgi:hypothetical protein
MKRAGIECVRAFARRDKQGQNATGAAISTQYYWTCIKQASSGCYPLASAEYPVLRLERFADIVNHSVRRHNGIF